MNNSSYKSGFVSILGKPNAGKSTLVNALMGQEILIISPLAQTTRHRILTIDTTDAYQIVYSDTPGIIRPKYRLHEQMMKSVSYAAEEVDVVVLLISVVETFPEDDMIGMIKKIPSPKILALNKIDLAKPETIEERKKIFTDAIDFEAVIEISALKKQGIDALKSCILERLPENPPYFDEESISDRPERFFVSEMVREQIFHYMKEEIPYSCDVSVNTFEEKPDIVRIQADIHVERKSQKGMLIGKGGSMLKQIGASARKRIEVFLDKKVFLELYVKVSDNWKDDAYKLRNLGYED